MLFRSTVNGINYRVDASSVGLTPLGPIAGIEAAERIVRENLFDLKILDLACGVGVIGLSVFADLESRIDELHFSDINIFNLNSLRRTLFINNLAPLIDKKIYLHLADALSGVPKLEFDLILSNPPDFYAEDFNKIEMSAGTLGRYSVGQSFHKSFYKECQIGRAHV